MFVYQTKIHLHDTDAAGLLFFANQFTILHDAYELMLETVGFGFADLLRRESFFLPIVHAESDYKAPLFVGDLIEVQVSVENIGTTSITLSYKVIKADQTLVGLGKTVHVTIDKKTGQKIPLPKLFMEKIKSLHGK